MAKTDGSRPDDAKGSRSRRVPLAEWIAGGLGAAAAVGMMAALAVDGIRTARTPADLAIEILDLRETAGGTALSVRVENKGGTTAADVRLAAEGPTGPAGAALLDYVPRLSQREAVLMLPAGTSRAAARVFILGYRDP